MNEKITLQDIIRQLTERCDIPKAEAETFVRTMFDVIEDALATDKYIKVKGLGTFKLIEVESRESVDVNTGERIEIQGHTKVSFVPDTGMRDLINKPFAHFETVILNENVRLEDTETVSEEEIVATPPSAPEPEDQTTERPQEDEEAHEETPVKPEEQPSVEPEETQVKKEEEMPVSIEHSDHRWRTVIIILIILCIVGSIGLFLL